MRKSRLDKTAAEHVSFSKRILRILSCVPPALAVVIQFVCAFAVMFLLDAAADGFEYSILYYLFIAAGTIAGVSPIVLFSLCCCVLDPKNKPRKPRWLRRICLVYVIVCIIAVFIGIPVLDILSYT